MAEARHAARPQVTQRQVLTAGFASIVAWSFDLFDLFILLFVASTIGPLFFPSDVPTLSLAATYASFAVTLLMRPVGSAIFGNYADRHGRKRAMIVAVTGVGIVTALMGAVPTIYQIGILAPIVFLLLRVVQGIFVGGVVASTHTIGTETVSERWRGLMSGAIGGGGAGLLELCAQLGGRIGFRPNWGQRRGTRCPVRLPCLLCDLFDLPGGGLLGVGMEVYVLHRDNRGNLEPVRVSNRPRIADLGSSREAT